MAEFIFGDQKKSFFKVLVEAIVVGLLLVLLCFILFLISDKDPLSRSYLDYILIGIAGSLFHILCEYSGINVWYSKNYCELYK